MTDLQKQIEELEKKANQIVQAMPSLKIGSFEFSCYQQGFYDGERLMAEKALSIIKKLEEELSSLRKVYDITNSAWKELKEECDKYKLLWETDAEDFKAITSELKNENKTYISCLRKINSCDDSATQQSREAHQVLKQFGKL